MIVCHVLTPYLNKNFRFVKSSILETFVDKVENIHKMPRPRNISTKGEKSAR